MDYYKFVVIEHYRDGGTWKHFFPTKQDALWAIEDLKEAHRGRTYELVEAL